MKGQIVSMVYRFRASSGEYTWIRTSIFAFQNPYNNELEYLIATNSLMNRQPATASATDQQQIDQSQQPDTNTAANQMYGNNADVNMQHNAAYSALQQTAMKSPPSVTSSVPEVMQYSPQSSSSYNASQPQQQQQVWNQQQQQAGFMQNSPNLPQQAYQQTAQHYANNAGQFPPQAHNYNHQQYSAQQDSQYGTSEFVPPNQNINNFQAYSQS